MRVRILVAAALVLALSGCGGGGAEPAAQETGRSEPSAQASATPSEDPAAGLPGEAANGDLSEFTCESGSGGAWSASGVLTSPSGSSDYQVTVAVAASGAGRTKARQEIVANVKKDDPKSFEVAHVPAGADGGTCRVQVVRLD
ncbi:MAG: hypothetical protein ACRDO8_04050 [Nocardioidaceae bacterium]